MHEIRRRFHEELRALEGEVQRTGTQAQLMLEKALQALTRRDLAVCEAVIRGDDEVDKLYHLWCGSHRPAPLAVGAAHRRCGGPAGTPPPSPTSQAASPP